MSSDAAQIPQQSIAGAGSSASPSGAGAPGPPASRERELIAAARAAAVAARKESSVVSALPLPQNFPGFEVLKEIHRGGQGVVYQAIQRATKRKVAIKVFHEGPFASARDRARFEREVDILAQLEHPNIVGIIDRGTTDNGGFFYVMDYVSGRTLDAFMTDPAGGIDDLLRLFAKVCDAMNAAHLKGIIHRDLKPSNIRVDQEGEPHILDFGLAKVSGPEVLNDPEQRLMTMTGQFVGSLPWASPEQASGASASVDVRTDVYSLGVVLYQLLTGGRFPYSVIGNMRDVLDNILRAEPAKPSTIRRQINDEVETIVLKALSKDRERRYQSAGDLARDIKRYLNGEPIEAKRDSGWYLLGKTISRHKMPFGAAAAMIVMIAGSAVALGLMYRQASVARDAARKGEAAALAARESEAQERVRAERNFAAVRGLARAFIFDFNDDVRDLRGATRARERILVEALAYLDKVKDQAAHDPAFMRELAHAYEKVGDIQGGLFLPNVGGGAEADASYAQARAIRESLLRLTPGDAGLLAEMGDSLRKSSWTLRRERRYAEALEESARAVRSYDSALAADVGEARADVEARRMHARADSAELLRRLGEEETDLTRAELRLEEARRIFVESEEFWRRRVMSSPDDEAAARELGVAVDDHARSELLAGAAARARAKAVGATDPSAALAHIERAIGHYREADRVAAEAAREFDRLSAITPQSAALLRALLLALHNQGEAQMRMGLAHGAARALGDASDVRERARLDAGKRALDLFTRALDIAEGLASSDEANVEARRDLALVLNKLGNQWGNLENFESSLRHLERSLDLRREIWSTDPTQIHRRDLALGLVRWSEAAIESVRIDEGADQKDAELLGRAKSLLEEATSHLRTLVEAGVLDAGSDEVRLVARRLDECESLLEGRSL